MSAAPDQTSLQRFVEARSFQFVVLVLIIINAVILGAETFRARAVNHRAAGEDDVKLRRACKARKK